MKIYIVPFQSKENNETKNPYLLEESSGDCGYRGRCAPEQAEEEAFDFLWCFQLWGQTKAFLQPEWVSRICPEVFVWASLRRGPAFCFFFHTARKKIVKTPKTNKNPTKTKHRVTRGMDLLVSQWIQGCLANPPGPQQLLQHGWQPQLVWAAMPTPQGPAFFTVAFSSPLEVPEIPKFQSNFSIFSIYLESFQWSMAK